MSLMGGQAPAGYGGYGGIGGGNVPGYSYVDNAYYEAALQAFEQSQAINDQLVGQMQQIANNQMGVSNELRQEWEQTFIPELNKLIQDANTYASAARIQLEMGKAEAGVAQAFDAQRQNALADLQSFGIDPSSGRYAALDEMQRSQEAAAQAGAGNTAYQQTEAIARALRSEALQASANLPGYANAAAGVAAGALRFPPNPAYPPSPPLVQRPTINRNPYANYNGPVGNDIKPFQAGVTPPKPQQNQGQQPQDRPTPTPSGGSRTTSQTSGGNSGNLPQIEGNPYAQPTPAGQSSAGQPYDANNAFSLQNQMNTPDLGGANYDPTLWQNTPTDSSSWTAQPGPTVEGGAPDPNSANQWNAPDTSMSDPNYDPWAAYDQSNSPGGNTDYSTGDPATYTPYDPYSYNTDNSTSPGGGQDLSSGPLSAYGPEYNNYQGPVGDSLGGDNSFSPGGGQDTSSGDPTNYDPSSYQQPDYTGYDTGGGGDFSKGGAIPFSRSPSRGRKTDDIRGRVRQTKEPINVDAGEFIIPRHAVAYKGKQFFQKIIDDSKKFHAKHGQRSQPPRHGIPMR